MSKRGTKRSRQAEFIAKKGWLFSDLSKPGVGNGPGSSGKASNERDAATTSNNRDAGQRSQNGRDV
jgi:hypothetical protein